MAGGVAARGAIAGAIGGLAGAWMMTRAAEAWIALRQRGERNEDRAATELLAQRVAATTLHRPLTSDELAVAAPSAHYALGALMGAGYGVACAAAAPRPVVGAAWGALVWIATAMAGARLLGLAGVRQMPGMSAQGFAVHVVYGVTNELVRAPVQGLWR